MFQATREPGRTRRLPAARRGDIRRLERDVLGVVVEQKVIYPGGDVIGERSGALHGALVAHVARDARPGAEEPAARRLLVHLGDGLVLEEARPAARLPQVLELLVDQRRVGQRHVVLRRAERREVRRRRVPDRVQRHCRARVRRVRARVVPRRPEYIVLRGRVVPDC